LNRHPTTGVEAGRGGIDAGAEHAGSNERSRASVDSETHDGTRFPDNFYAGLIIFLDGVRGRGVVRTSSGREIRFEFPFVEVVGAPPGGKSPGIEQLREGDRIGFDVGWTSKGLRVTKIKPNRES
jgi:hypothetical protein